MKEIELKNGAVEADVLVNETMISLLKLLDEVPLAVYDLAEKCKNREYNIFGPNVKVLELLGFISGPKHQIHDSIRSIVLSAIEGDGIDMTLGNPVKLDAQGVT